MPQWLIAVPSALVAWVMIAVLAVLAPPPDKPSGSGAPAAAVAEPTSRPPAAQSPAAGTPSASDRSLTPEERRSLEADAGIPPEPDRRTWAAYIAGLVAIDPDIVHGKEEKAVDRGRNQCRSIAEHRQDADRSKLVELARQRFTSPGHPDGFGSAAAKILVVVHRYLCPSYPMPPA